MYVIAAVVVGGTSLSGGTGRILGSCALTMISRYDLQTL